MVLCRLELIKDYEWLEWIVSWNCFVSFVRWNVKLDFGRLENKS